MLNRKALVHQLTSNGKCNISGVIIDIGVDREQLNLLPDTKVERAVNKAVIQVGIAQYIPLLSIGVAGIATNNQTPAPDRIVPHPMTLRKAREQVKQMVIDGLSARRIRSYPHRYRFPH